METMQKTDDLFEKRDLFLEMKDLAQRQKDLVMENKMEFFFELFKRREGLQRAISAHNPRLKVSVNGAPDAPRDRRARSLLDDVARIIQSIQDIDRQIEAFVHDNKDRLLKDIKGLRKGQKALKGYGGRAPRNPRFIDTEG